MGNHNSIFYELHLPEYQRNNNRAVSIYEALENGKKNKGGNRKFQVQVMSVLGANMNI